MTRRDLIALLGRIQIWGSPVPEYARPKGHPDISPSPMDLRLDGLDAR